MELEYACQNVTSIITLLDVNAEKAEYVQNEFEGAMGKAIAAGRLQAVLSIVNRDTLVRVVREENLGEDNIADMTTSPTPAAPASAPPTGITTESTGSSSPPRVSTAGIIVAACVGAAILMVPVLILLYRRNKNESTDDSALRTNKNVVAIAVGDSLADNDNMKPKVDDHDGDFEQPTTSMTSSSEHVTSGSDMTSSPVNQQTLKNVTSSSSSTSSSGYETPVGDASIPITPARKENEVSRSHCSNAGAMGLGTAAAMVRITASDSEDSFVSAASSGLLPHVSLSTSTIDIAMGSASADDIGFSHSSTTEEATRMRLDQALQQHDWVVVGEAAAAMAAVASEHDTALSLSRSSTRHSHMTDKSMASGVSVETKKVKQLDRLVAEQDWEGLVQLAARFEAEESEHRNRSRSIDQSTGGSDASSSASAMDRAASLSDMDSHTSASASSCVLHSPKSSASTSISGNAGSTQSDSELREKIISLVERVVPEELKNVDEMLQQFKGREEELIETLRSMQERSVTRKARVAQQKAAKAEAKHQAQSKRLNESSASTVFRLPKHRTPVDTGSDNEGEAHNLNEFLAASNKSQDLPRQTGSGSDTESDSAPTLAQSLERAIELGDWHAVAEAAALLSDTSATGDNRSSVTSRLSGISSVDLDGLQELDAHPTKEINTNRLKELDQMIVAGDWNGVIEASQRYSEEDEGVIELGRSREEEEALHQAALWEKIAEKSRSGAAAGDAAAVSATEWAIERSLSQLREKEQVERGEKEGRGSDSEV